MYLLIYTFIDIHIYSLHLGVHNICYTNLSQQSNWHLLWVAEWRPPRPHCAVPCRCLQCLGANGKNPPGKWGIFQPCSITRGVVFRFENHAKNKSKFVFGAPAPVRNPQLQLANLCSDTYDLLWHHSVLGVETKSPAWNEAETTQNPCGSMWYKTTTLELSQW